MTKKSIREFASVRFPFQAGSSLGGMTASVAELFVNIDW